MESIKINWKVEIDPLLLNINRSYEEDYKGFHFNLKLTNSLYSKEYSSSVKMRATNLPNDSGKEIYRDSSKSSSLNFGPEENIDKYIDDIQENLINALNHTKSIIDSCLRDVEIEGYNKEIDISSNELQILVENVDKSKVKTRERKVV